MLKNSSTDLGKLLKMLVTVTNVRAMGISSYFITFSVCNINLWFNRHKMIPLSKTLSKVKTDTVPNLT